MLFIFNECFYLISEDEWSEYSFIYARPRYGQPPDSMDGMCTSILIQTNYSNLLWENISWVFFSKAFLDRKFPFRMADTLAGNDAEIRAGSASSYILRISLSRKSTLSRKVWRTIHTLAQVIKLLIVRWLKSDVKEIKCQQSFIAILYKNIIRWNHHKIGQ